MLVPRKILWLALERGQCRSRRIEHAVAREPALAGRHRIRAPARGRGAPPSSLGQSLAWAAGVGAAAGAARVVSRRSAALVWEKTTGEAPPGETAKL